MFIRRRGRKFLLLHSYRDGSGKVCQRRLGDFHDAASLERQLGQLPQRCPEIEVDLPRLRLQAETMLDDHPPEPDRTPAQRVEGIRRATRALLTLLAEEEDAEVLRQAATDLSLLRSRLNESPTEGEDEESLRALVRDTRSRLSPRRRRFDSSDVQARPYLRSLERLSELLSSQGRLSESAAVMAERVASCPTGWGRLVYGAMLQEMGRGADAMEQYAGLPNREAWRHYNLASACWQEKRPEEALVHLLRGLTLDPLVVEALRRQEQGKEVRRGMAYWDDFGRLWTAEGRRFILAICDEHLVRRRLRLAHEQRVKVRKLIPAHSRVWLLERGLAAVAGAPLKKGRHAGAISP